jgi:hypothetical protein
LGVGIGLEEESGGERKRLIGEILSQVTLHITQKSFALIYILRKETYFWVKQYFCIIIFLLDKGHTLKNIYDGTD